MKKEFMSSVPESIFASKIDVNEYYQTDDTVYKGFTIKDFILYLENDRDFYENRTKEQMEKAFKQFLKEEIELMKSDSDYYIKNIIPIFLKGEFKK